MDNDKCVNENKSQEKPLDLDDVLINELGQFGWFQLRNLLLLAIPLMMSAFINEYVFSAMAVKHRCRIPECGDTNETHQINPIWLNNTVPPSLTGLSSCERYAPKSIEIPGDFGEKDTCLPTLFDNNHIIPCDAGYVYESTNSVVYEFDLGCQDWLRALAGTLNSIGTLLVLPITGYISDRFGRRLVLILNIFNLGLFGLLRAFSVNYTMYLILQIVQTTLGSGTVSAGYILAAELIGPKYRVVGIATLSSMFATGQIVMASVAWLTPSWRAMLIALHIPCFFIVTYFWLLSESVRWLLSKRQFEKAKKILETVARINKTQISNKSMEALMNPPTKIVTTSSKKGLITSILHSKILLRRICTTPIWWITACFVYYGLSINSTSLSESKYSNYILTCAIEIPGFFTATVVLNRIGRRATLSTCFFFGAVCNLAFILISPNLYVLRLIFYLLGKFSISTSMTALYLYTSELYPTEYRHSLLAFSSMIGRIGSITAPLTPVLMNYWHGIPSLMFSIMGILSGILVLTQPETLGTKLPDTLEEAESLGNNQNIT
ncbi:unnamed protein product [Danaus chrysippus]|uniref:(African queen) hypothetical protein n=1 Tax=Danaus chrysippus TaxID=151541 RepID=A0A8J2QHE9_9NEOP|nr:unnamed protein product [Danaus chrysippus]